MECFSHFRRVNWALLRFEWEKNYGNKSEKGRFLVLFSRRKVSLCPFPKSRISNPKVIQIGSTVYEFRRKTWFVSLGVKSFPEKYQNFPIFSVFLLDTTRTDHNNNNNKTKEGYRKCVPST